ncbi:MAG: hypothetical protein WC464_00145 [Bdellovibrionales bacterium]
MMSKKIIHSDAFLDMPATSQNLYFHLLLEADDEGFVNSPKRIQRTIGASDGDAQMLIAKKFILSFESGVIVIKHWRIHNYIQNDRFKVSSHFEERSKLVIKDNNAYSLNDGYNLDTNCTPSLGEDSIGKVSIVENIDQNDFDLFWKHYPKKVGKDKALIAWKKKKNKPSIQEILEAVQRYKLSKTVRDGFVCHPTTWINEGRWSDEVELSDYDKAKAIQEHTGMSAEDTLEIQLAEAQRKWEEENGGMR